MTSFWKPPFKKASGKDIEKAIEAVAMGFFVDLPSKMLDRSMSFHIVMSQFTKGYH